MWETGRHRGRHVQRQRTTRPWPLVLGLVLVLVAVGAIWLPRALAWRPTVIAAVPYWDLERGLVSVAQHGSFLDEVTPWWYGLAPDGSIVSDLPGGADAENTALIRAGGGGMRLVPTVASTNKGVWAPHVVHDILQDTQRMNAHTDALVSLAVSHGFAGLQIDYEDLEAGDRDLFTSFVTILAARMHERDKVLYVTVHPKTTDAGYDARNMAQDYAALGRTADRLVIMAYDWHWQASEPGPIAPASWVEEVVRYTLSQVPADRVVLGLGLYGYDWVGARGEPVVWRQVEDLVARTGATPAWDEASASPHLEYTLDGAVHEVWYEDARSFDIKLALAEKYGLAGVELWRLGDEDPGTWTVIRDRAT
ncbi:glycosyl hydrolase family 18 protein [Pseudonocardia lutea]|uniref:Glycosyl hydrolase family 18 protein n=1 Tax=Pseudonocardia lutea TaxID=2172015 RepID=A0ABW1I6C2_9PSEU